MLIILYFYVIRPIILITNQHSVVQVHFNFKTLRDKRGQFDLTVHSRLQYLPGEREGEIMEGNREKGEGLARRQQRASYVCTVSKLQIVHTLRLYRQTDTHN